MVCLQINYFQLKRRRYVQFLYYGLVRFNRTFISCEPFINSHCCFHILIFCLDTLNNDRYIFSCFLTYQPEILLFFAYLNNQQISHFIGLHILVKLYVKPYNRISLTILRCSPESSYPVYFYIGSMKIKRFIT